MFVRPEKSLSSASQGPGEAAELNVDQRHESGQRIPIAATPAQEQLSDVL
jgi:hypothetical protein